MLLAAGLVTLAGVKAWALVPLPTKVAVAPAAPHHPPPAGAAATEESHGCAKSQQMMNMMKSGTGPDGHPIRPPGPNR